APAGGWPTRVQHPLYRIALVWTVVMVLVLGWLAVTRGIPRSPESGVMGTGLEVPLHVGLLVLLLAGVLLAARFHVAGAVVVALAATLLGYASSVEYAPWVAVLLTVAGFVPALLLWVQWHRVASPRAALTLAALTSALLVGLVYLAATNYTYYWGPTHPTSATPAPDDDVVEWMWSGAVTPTSVTVRARTAGDAARVRLAVSTRPTLDAARYSPARPSRAADDNIVSLTVSGLAPGRDHYYALEVDGVLDTARVGRVTTFPRGPASFTFAVAGDSRTGSNGQVYDAVRRTDPLFYLNVGDFFYGDVDRNDRALYLRQYQANLTAPAQAALYARAPIAYIWGDHDFASNDADSTAPGRPASLAVYRQVVPHYALPSGRQAPIFQAFTVGDVRFVLTDNRSRRDPPGEAARSMLGRAQLRMLQRELDGADRYGLLVWANADPWVDRADPTTDTWGGFAVERRRISRMIAASDVRNLLAVSGDAHMLAYDDGSHTDYSGTGRAGFPLFQAAALDRKPSVKGGPYTGPVIPGGGQFGLVHVRDDGRTVRVSMDGMNWRGEQLFRRTFTVTRGGS
ncbi:MAG TPA: alkaline phosphatase D family protein, partial [Nocardioidaceae bacterium]|nr:alkaline phosphatase D family protein [Nocardioidaceae bacterium]